MAAAGPSVPLAAVEPGSPSPPREVLDPALRLLSTRPRSVRELKDRLLKKGFELREVTSCIRWLEARNLLSDEAFARSLTLDRIRFSPRSPFLLKREITTRGVGTSLAGRVVDSVLEEEDLSAARLAAHAAESWIRKQSSASRRQLLGGRFTQERERIRRRLYGFLNRRGFVGDAARQGMEAGEKKARELELDPS